MVPNDFPRESLPLVVAHRGASAAYPENTLESFSAAVDAGADAVEFDVRLSADGHPVVVHDPDVSRVSDGHGLVHELSLAELKALDVSGGLAGLARLSGRAEIPTLAEVLDALSGRIGIDIEIKNIPGEPGFDSPREAALEATLRVLDAAGFSGPVLISSFNWLTIERSLVLAPEVPTGFLSVGGVDPSASLVYAMEAGHRWILPQAEAVLAAGEEFVAEAHRGGVRVGTWVTDDEAGLRALFASGVDAVATNDPALAGAVKAGGRPGP